MAQKLSGGLLPPGMGPEPRPNRPRKPSRSPQANTDLVRQYSPYAIRFYERILHRALKYEHPEVPESEIVVKIGFSQQNNSKTSLATEPHYYTIRVPRFDIYGTMRDTYQFVDGADDYQRYTEDGLMFGNMYSRFINHNSTNTSLQHLLDGDCTFYGIVWVVLPDGEQFFPGRHNLVHPVKRSTPVLAATIVTVEKLIQAEELAAKDHARRFGTLLNTSAAWTVKGFPVPHIVDNVKSQAGSIRAIFNPIMLEMLYGVRAMRATSIPLDWKRVITRPHFWPDPGPR